MMEETTEETNARSPIDFIEREDPEIIHEDLIPQAGIPSSMINILNTLMGAGMLVLPSAISSLGIILGLCMIGFSGILAAFGLMLLVRCAEYVGRTSSFNTVSLITFPFLAPFFDLAVGVKCFGVATSYLIVIGDVMPDAANSMFRLPPEHILRLRQFWITMAMVIIIPFTFLRRLDSLKYTSFLALIAILYLFILVIYFYADPLRIPPPADDVHLFNPQWKFFANLTVFIFAFTCHQNIFAVYNELKRNTMARTNTIIIGSISIATIMYMVVAVLGYLTYGDNVDGNILKNFPDNILATVARIAITILNAFSFPLQCHPSRASFEKVYEKIRTVVVGRHSGDFGDYGRVQGEDATSEGEVEEKEEVEHVPSVYRMSNSRFVVITVSILLLSYLIAFFVQDLKLILGLVGATGSTTICYVLPGLFYAKLQSGKPMTVMKFWAAAMCMFGLLLMPMCIAFIIIYA